MEDNQTTREMWWDYQILDEISRDENVSQRDLSKSAGMALGRTNQVVKRLIRKGLVKTRQINAKRVAYYLTPQGFAEKLRLVVQYAQITINLFSYVREMINGKLDELKRERNIRTVAIVGSGELAEAVYLSIQEKGLELTAVYDIGEGRDVWLGRMVHSLDYVPEIKADVVMITEMEDLGREKEKLDGLGHTIVEVRELLSEQLASFVSRINEEDPKRSQNVKR